MTYKQFLAELRKTPRQWKTTHLLEVSQGCIRYKKELTCPMQKLAGVDQYTDVVFCAVTLGLSRNVANRILHGADGWPSYKKTRRDLLKACGLKEKS